GGSVTVDGRALEPHTAREAIARGIGMVQQHFALVDGLTVLENIVLGVEPVRTGLDIFRRGWRVPTPLDLDRARARAEEILARLGAELTLDDRVERLGVGDRQRLEIARTLYRDAKVMILDEPTAVLTPLEADALFAMLRRLADAGRSVVV